MRETPVFEKKIKEILRKGIEFEKELDEAVHVDESELQYFFKDLSTHCSIARMLIMPYTFMGEAQSGKFFFEELLNMNPQQRIKKCAVICKILTAHRILITRALWSM